MIISPLNPGSPTHTLASFILLQVQEVVHSPLVIVFCYSILYVLVLSHLKELLYLFRKLVGGEIVISLLKVLILQWDGREMLFPVEITGWGKGGGGGGGGEGER